MCNFVWQTTVNVSLCHLCDYVLGDLCTWRSLKLVKAHKHKDCGFLCGQVMDFLCGFWRFITGSDLWVYSTRPPLIFHIISLTNHKVFHIDIMFFEFLPTFLELLLFFLLNNYNVSDDTIISWLFPHIWHFQVDNFLISSVLERLLFNLTCKW